MQFTCYSYPILTKLEFSQFIFEKTGQCTYNLSLRRVFLTIVLWKHKKCYIICVCICSLRCPAFNAHAPYFHLWPVRIYSIFTQYSMNGTNFEKKPLLNVRCGL
jgi:hypothetical protein